MRAGTARGLAWGLWALWAALAAFGLALAAAGEVSSDAAFLLLFAAFATVGALIASRRPKNTIGWLFCALALGWTIDLLFEGYTKAHPNSESALALAAWWMRSWFWFLWLGTAAFFVPLLYPGGRLPSPRWRWALWLAAIWVGIATVGAAFRPGVMEVPGQAEGEIENPVGIPAAASAIDALDVAQTALFFICLALSVAALVVRFRRARGDERHQLKWSSTRPG